MNYHYSIYKKVFGGALAALLLGAAPLRAQQDNALEVLNQIEQNNTQIEAARKALSATITENKTGLNLKNPEVEFEHKWDTKTPGAKTNELTVMQELDWAVLSGQRKNLSRKKNELAEISFLQTRNSVLLQAQKKLIELAYYNRLLDELQTQLQDADSLASIYETMLKNGSGNILDVNRSKLNRVSVQTEMRSVRTQKEVVLQDLCGLNGGQPVSYDGHSAVCLQELPEDFDSWFRKVTTTVPELRFYQKDVEVKQQNLQSTKREMIPALSVGYTAELNESEHLHGFALGMSIPLWENKNKIKKSKQDVEAAKSNVQDAEMRVYNQLKAQYVQTQKLRESLSFQKNAVEELNTTALMKEALMKGEINLMDYLTEASRYYEYRKNLLATEKDYQTALADLHAVEL